MAIVGGCLCREARDGGDRYSGVRFPKSLLAGLGELVSFAFRLDRLSHDQFGVMELVDRAGATHAHRGADRSHDILSAVGAGSWPQQQTFHR